MEKKGSMKPKVGLISPKKSLKNKKLLLIKPDYKWFPLGLAYVCRDLKINQSFFREKMGSGAASIFYLKMNSNLHLKMFW
tara:strand:+ start:51 stop:290 length:240 start_codon:yes stop_codon:yes gene_type:complete